MTRSVGWGIIGCGDVADRKAGASFNANQGSQLVSVMRRDAAGAEAFAQRHGAEHWTTDACSVIEHPRVDIVYVATPPANHLEYALAAAAAGKACLVEKPAGRCLAEFTQIREAFRKARLPLYVSYYRRHLPRFLKVKEIIDSGALGEIVSVDYRMSKRLHKPVRASAWASDVAVSGGGQFYALACHILDLFDFWFGALELTGASATNAVPARTSEDAVAISFRSATGVVGNALWNFAASGSGDQLIIDGVRGRITMQGTAADKPITVDFDESARARLSHTRSQRWLNKQRGKLGLPVATTFRFDRVELPHKNLLAALTGAIGAGRGEAVDNADAALRTAQLLDRALAPYYGGRNDAFWDHPERWRSLQAEASRRNQSPLPDAYRLTEAQLKTFEQDGYVGPFRCDADWQRLLVPVKKGRNHHLEEADLFNVCTHPSVIRRVAQVMGSPRFSLFKTRYVVKLPRSKASVAWHQDVGKHNGGFTADGKAVPTLAVWMGIDEIDPGNGGLQVIPGSNSDLIGDYDKQIKSALIESGALTIGELNRARPVVLKPGEFIIYHGWLLHGSSSNDSDRRRAGLNMRFAPAGLECEDEYLYMPLHTADVELSTRVFDNAVWNSKPNAQADPLGDLAEAG